MQNKSTFLIPVLALFAFGGSATLRAQTEPPAATQPATTRPARPDQSPVLADNTVLSADVPYGGPDAKLDVLDIYAPKGAANAPVLIFVHGGEWSRGDKKQISYKPQFFNTHGVIFVSTNYRLSPQYKHPAQVDDVATAIAWVHAHIAEYGGDPTKIVIMGHSAGCHLVTLVSLNPEFLGKVGMKPSDLRGVVAWSGGMYDLAARAKAPGMYPPFIKATFGDDEAAQRAASPDSYADLARGSTSFLFASVDDDKSQSSRDATNEIVGKIVAAGGKAQSTILVDRSHIMANHMVGAPGDQTGQKLLDFISSVTK